MKHCSPPRHMCINEYPPPVPERSASGWFVDPDYAWEREKLDPPCGQKLTPNVSPGITFVPVPPPVSRSVKLRRKVMVTAPDAPGARRAPGDQGDPSARLPRLSPSGPPWICRRPVL